MAVREATEKELRRAIRLAGKVTVCQVEYEWVLCSIWVGSGKEVDFIMIGIWLNVIQSSSSSDI